MAFLVFVLSLVLLVAGLGAGYLSLDLLPTGPGMLDAFAGVAAVVGAIIVFALGLLILRIGRLTTAVREQGATTPISTAAPLALADEPAELAPGVEEAEQVEVEAEAEAVEAQAVEGEGVEIEPALEPDSGWEAQERPAAAEAEPALEAGETHEEARDFEDAVNENRVGHLPTLGEIERAIETPERPPTLIGRYASGGANYMIFSDGSIEAETDEGAFKFGSMGEFKRFLLDRGIGKA
jgi:hypothetical protein